MSTELAAGPTTANRRIAIWAATLVCGIALVLTAQFMLDGWADSTEGAHWAQHAILFVAGLTTGAAVLRLYQLGSRAARDSPGRDRLVRSGRYPAVGVRPTRPR